MSKTWLKTIAALAASLFLLSCWQNGNQEGSSVPEVKGFELLSHIPSDACGVIVCDKTATGIENIMDNRSVFREFSYGALADSRMVISFHFQGELIPMLAIDAGRTQTAIKQATPVMEAAAEFGLQSRLVAAPAKKRGGNRSVLLLSPSEPLIDAAERHLEAHTSVLEVEGLKEALEKAPSKGDVVIFRNDAIANILPKNFLSKYVTRRQLTGFIKGWSDWTVLHLTGSEAAGKGVYLSYDVRTVHPEDYSKAVKVYEDQGYGESKIPDIIPQGTTYVVDLPLSSVETFIESRKKNLDAGAGLNKFVNTCAQLKKNTGVDPVKWAIETDIKEIAKIQWKDEEVLIIRPAKPLVSHNVRYNSHRGFATTLFGQGFSLADDSHAACIGNWLIMGSESAVKHFMASEVRQKLHYWPTKNVKAIVLADDCQLAWTRSELRFDVYRTY
ncbi:MAG: hypothetical protein J6X39_04170 [Bacteroidales bacterium]|nr:hypothetical protein [Bacteroidales bacterium]